jgi:hypothetical protein
MYNQKLIQDAYKNKKTIFEENNVLADKLINNLSDILSKSDNYISDHNPILFIEN